jgi:hypothetical protein
MRRARSLGGAVESGELSDQAVIRSVRGGGSTVELTSERLCERLLSEQEAR